MKRGTVLAVAMWLVAVTAGLIGAPRLTLTIRDGRVWIAATDVPVRQILAEWSLVGGIRLVDGERILPDVVTLQFDGVPEDEALKALLRTASGFIAVPRRVMLADRSSSLSRFESIFILSTVASTAAQPPVHAGSAIASISAPSPVVASSRPVRAIPVAPGVQRLIGPDGQPVPDDQERAPHAEPIRIQTPIYTPPGFADPPQVAPSRR